MTLEESRALRLGAHVAPSGLSFAVPCSAQVPPPDESTILRPEVQKPLTQKDYNGIPVQDVEALRAFRGMDALHRSDALGEAANRGNRLKGYLKEHGLLKFKSRYGIKD